MNSYQLKLMARSRRNIVVLKVQRPSLNFEASKEKAKDRKESSSIDQNGENDLLMIILVVMIMIS
jgi:hypothetical protein